MIYRVTYPLLTTDGHRDFPTRNEAEAFARDMRDRQGNMWRHVQVTELWVQEATPR